MRPLRYSINASLDGCVDHAIFTPDDELHAHHAAKLPRADALLFGRMRRSNHRWDRAATASA